MKKTISLVFLVICALVMLSVTLRIGDDDNRLRLGLQITQDGYEDIIYPFYDEAEEVYYYFLPSFVEECYISDDVYSFDKRIKVDGKILWRGEQFSWRENEKTDVKIGNKEFSVVFLQDENLPAMFIDTETGGMEYVCEDKNNRESGYINVFDSNGNGVYQGKLKISGRGNSTWSFCEKKPFNINLDDEVSILGMPASTKWCLMANAWDYSYMNNYLSYDMADYVGLEHTPKVAYTDVYFNGEYWGLYLLSEAIEVSENRINISDLERANIEANETVEISKADTFDTGTTRGVVLDNNPSDITGGYILERDKRTSADYAATRVFPTSWFETSNKTPIGIKAPKHATEAEVEYVKNLVEELENAILSKDGYSQKKKYYTDYIDLESWVKWYIVCEIAYDMDKGGTNTSMYKYDSSVSDRFYMGPIWDFDCRWGGDADYASPEVLSKLSASIGPNWFEALYEKEEFYSEICDQWPLFKKYLSDIAPVKINDCRDFIRQSVYMDKIRWNDKGYSLDERTDYLKDWIEKREAFLSSCWESE